jgi:hypothetical protein
MRKFYVTYILGSTCQVGKVIHDEEVWLKPGDRVCAATFKRHLFGDLSSNHTIIAWSLIEE